MPDRENEDYNEYFVNSTEHRPVVTEGGPDPITPDPGLSDWVVVLGIWDDTRKWLDGEVWKDLPI